jgi:hypothetical protein
VYEAVSLYTDFRIRSWKQPVPSNEYFRTRTWKQPVPSNECFRTRSWKQPETSNEYFEPVPGNNQYRAMNVKILAQGNNDLLLTALDY